MTNGRAIAFLGLGIMGTSMVSNLSRSGCQITAWNRTKKDFSALSSQGVLLCNSLPAAVSDADLIFVCLPDVPDVEELLFSPEGAAAHAKKGSIIIDTSTVGPTFAKDAAERLRVRSIGYLDAPFSGGDIGGRNATLTFMVGGAEEDFLKCAPYLQFLGRAVKHCGPVGAGQTVKLCNQVLCAVNMLAVCESIRVAEILNVDAMTMIELCGTGAGASWALTNLGPRIAQADLSPGFVLDHMINNLRLLHDSVDLKEQRLAATLLAETSFSAVRDKSAQEQRLGTQALINFYRTNEI